jgi:glyoxylase-like metal-dependent hydrolase (beta-lactamase superfamily II)
MKLTALDCERFRLDAGSMFGRVPKAIWGKQTAVDDQNRMALAARALLVEHAGRRVLIDAGIGAGRAEKFHRIYQVDDSAGGVEGALARAGVAPSGITDVLLTHLHWDHAGGAAKPAADGSARREAAFPAAAHHVGARHWAWAASAPRWEQASYVADDVAALAGLAGLRPAEHGPNLFPEMTCLVHDGHTEGLLMPLLDVGGRKLLFASDLIPTRRHVRLPFIMGFDIRPLVTYQTKRTVLSRAADEGWGVFLEHDPEVEVVTIRRDGDDFAAGEEMTLAAWAAG